MRLLMGEKIDQMEKEDAFIVWRQDAQHLNITKDEFHLKLKDCLEHGKKARNRCHDKAWFTVGCYYYKKGERQEDLFIHEQNGYFHYWINKFEINGLKKHGLNGGRGAIAKLQEHHKQRTGNTLLKEFGYVDKEFRVCVPKNFYWDNFKEYPTGIIYHNISSIDGCSQYPAGFMGGLPTSKGAIRYKGTVAPNEEYPFAFYLKSGHIAQYKIFDTHTWITEPLVYRLFKLSKYENNDDIQNPYLPLDEDETVLMKKARFGLSEDFKYFYNIKETYDHDSEEYKAAKLVMNAAIGMMHRNDKDKSYDEKPYRLAHIAAVAIARANNSILSMAKKIGYRHILQIMVDGIVYIGQKMGENTKKLGKYHQEIFKQDYLACAHGVYAFRDRAGNITKYKHLGRDIWNDGTPIDDKKLTKLEDIYLWERKKDSEE